MSPMIKIPFKCVFAKGVLQIYDKSHFWSSSHKPVQYDTKNTSNIYTSCTWLASHFMTNTLQHNQPLLSANYRYPRDTNGEQWDQFFFSTHRVPIFNHWSSLFAQRRWRTTGDRNLSWSVSVFPYMDAFLDPSFLFQEQLSTNGGYHHW